MEKTVFIALMFIFAVFVFANEQFDRILAFANAGDADSCYDVSLCYQYGYLDVEPDDEQAVYWAKKAAELGVSDAMVDVGIYYLTLRNDWKTAEIYFNQAANLDNPNGFYMLGYCYSNAVGVQKNIHLGIEYYKKASEIGSPIADYQLGALYYYGTDVERNYTESFKYMLKAAEAGETEAQYIVSYMYEGGIGVGKDLQKAAEWLEKAEYATASD